MFEKLSSRSGIALMAVLLLFSSSCGVQKRATAMQKKVSDGELVRVIDIPRLTALDGSLRVVQGMDILGDKLYIGFDGGYCRVMSLKNLSVLGEFPLGSNVPSNHCGNLDFGIEKPVGSDIPALYVSGDLKTFSCYVEAVTDTSSQLIQTIKFDLDNGFNGSQVIIDHDLRCIWYQQRKLQKIGDKDNVFAVYRFRLPALEEGDVTFTANDAIDFFEFPKYKRIYQGAEIAGGCLWIVNGYLKGSKTSKASELTVFDLRSNSVAMEKDISSVGREPQGCSFYKGHLYILFDNALWMVK